MNLKKLLLTKNACYLAGKKITPKGIVVHSTGANNPNLRRYVNPDDGLLGKNTGGNHWNQKKPDGRDVCVHAFIGLLCDGKTVATYQTLPWDMRGWHGGRGSKGSVNDGYIGFEICEGNLTDAAYFNKVYKEAVELCAMLCKQYGIKPDSPTLICHSEAYKLEMASNHGDVMHWFPQHGKSMDAFRADVRKAMRGAAPAVPPTQTPATPKPASNHGGNEAAIWAFFKRNCLNDFAIAGLMGNLFAESALNPKNLQNNFQTKLGYTDEEYTAAVDSGKYANFIRDSAGYGLAQWTFWSRKENLLQFARLGGKSIGDLQTQLEFLWRELKGYTSVITALMGAKSVRQVSDVVLLDFERPADQSEAVKVKRAGYGQGYYAKYAEKATAPISPAKTFPYTVRVTDSALNVRKGPGTNYAVVGCIKDKGVYTITGEAAGPGASMWLKLKSGAGYISRDFTKKL